MDLAPLMADHGIQLKINTVITAYNANDDLIALIKTLNPQRWKVFKFLPIFGENDKYLRELYISDEEFHHFIGNHQKLSPVVEFNRDMCGSYIMIDPKGRLFQNTLSKLEFSRSILKIGLFKALTTLGWDTEKFIGRGGIYNW